MFFWKKKNKVENNQPVKEKIASKIVSFILKMQTGFANYMNKKTRNIPNPTMKIIVISFCIVFGTYSIYLVTDSVLRKNEKVKTIQIDRLNVPKYIDRSTDNPSGIENRVTKSLYEKLQAFRYYMDSLHSSTSGRHIYDSILLNRPHLMDSVLLLEQLYQTNKK